MPKLVDADPLRLALARLVPDEPRTHRGLTVIPLLAPGTDDPDWLTLPEAGDAVQITEVTEAGEVPFLTVVNAGDRPVLLLDGEELVGAKQNRVLNTTVLVGARAEVRIPVSCVEWGRWAYRERRLVAGNVSLFSSLRAVQAAHVTASLRAVGLHAGDQHGLWHELDRKARDAGVASPTGAMHTFFEVNADQVQQGAKALAAAPAQTAALVFVGGKWAGLELLASPGLFARTWPRLLSGYLAEALRAPKPVGPLSPAEALLQLIGESSARSTG